MSLARLVIGPKEAGGGGGAAIISVPEKDVDNYHYIFLSQLFFVKRKWLFSIRFIAKLSHDTQCCLGTM